MRNLVNSILGPILNKLGLSRKVYLLIHRIKQKDRKSQMRIRNFTVVNRPDKINNSLSLICIIPTGTNSKYINQFLDYYRKLGVSVFYLFSGINIVDEIIDKTDCILHSVSQLNDDLGVKFYNSLIKKFIKKDKWFLIVPLNNFIVYSNIESRNLLELADYLNNLEEPLLFTTTVDLYCKNGDLGENINSNKHPFEVYKYFDKYNFIQKFDEKTNSYKVYGGPISRLGLKLFPEKLKNLHFPTLIKNTKGMGFFEKNVNMVLFQYNNTLNRESRAINGALFRLVLAPKEVLGDANVDSIYHKDWSVEYKNSSQLEDLKIIQRGEWF